jgi:hypothetical protein
VCGMDRYRLPMAKKRKAAKKTKKAAKKW